MIGFVSVPITDLTQAEAEARRADTAEREKQKLAEKLREMGINPEELL